MCVAYEAGLKSRTSEKTRHSLTAPKVKSKVNPEGQVLSATLAEPQAGPCGREAAILPVQRNSRKGRWACGFSPLPHLPPLSGVLSSWDLPTIASLSGCAQDSHPLPPQLSPRLRRARGGHYQCPPGLLHLSLGLGHMTDLGQ